MESDYTLLYLHHGLTSDNKPSLSWLRDAYREFDRKWVGTRGWAPEPRVADSGLWVGLLGAYSVSMEAGPQQLCPFLHYSQVSHLACRYKKNIKALYIVHPTMFIKTLLILFKPLIR